MHIIRAFTHLQVRKIPEKYIRKRYTRSARQEVTWDRHDGVLIGPAASQEQTRMSSLLPKLMKLGRAGSRSDRACQETNRQLDKIIPGIEMFPRSMENGSPGSGPSATESVATTAHPANDDTTANGSLGSGPSATGSVVTTTQPDNGSAGSQPSSALLHDGLLLIEPPVARTKGRGKKRKNEVEPPRDGIPFSTYDKENYGNKECSGCGVWGSHYVTTCPINPDRSKAAEMRLHEKSAKANAGPPRKRGRPKIVRDLHEESDVDVAEVAKTEPSSSAHRGAGRGRGSATRGRGGRAPCVNCNE